LACGRTRAWQRRSLSDDMARGKAITPRGVR
jgi:hypothetical protein